MTELRNCTRRRRLGFSDALGDASGDRNGLSPSARRVTDLQARVQRGVISGSSVTGLLTRYGSVSSFCVAHWARQRAAAVLGARPPV